MPTFSISPSITHSVSRKETKFLRRVTTDDIRDAQLTPNDYNYVQLIHKDPLGQGLFRVSNYSTFIDAHLYWGIIGDEFNDLQ